MSKHVLLVGHCGPDASYLRAAISKAARGARITAADDAVSLTHALSKPIDLVLVNRVLDGSFDDTDGIELIRQFKTRFPAVKFMLVSNYAEAHVAAMAAGALEGFGKRDIGSDIASNALSNALEKPS